MEKNSGIILDEITDRCSSDEITEKCADTNDKSSSEVKRYSMECIHCGLCTKNCTFLSKYGMDLSDFESRQDLAYNCFLCGKCKIVCPKDIDGRKIAISMRKKHLRANKGKINFKGYNGIIWEKKNYLFKNYRRAKVGKSAIFTGCNFLSYLPKTADKLIDLMRKYGIGAIFDCCGKPISELGFEDKEKNIIESLNRRLKENGIEELIMVCPNCYYFLKGKLNVKIVDIYSKLIELDAGIGLLGDEHKAFDKEVNGVGHDDKVFSFFRPCPDRESNELFGVVKSFYKDGKINVLREQCCGAGGCASAREGELSRGFRTDIKEQLKGEILYTYCATCVGFFRMENIATKHVLSDILDIEEDCTGNSLINRVKYAFK